MTGESNTSRITRVAACLAVTALLLMATACSSAPARGGVSAVQARRLALAHVRNDPQFTSWYDQALNRPLRESVTFVDGPNAGLLPAHASGPHWQVAIVAGAGDDPAAVVDVGLDGTVTNVTYSYSIEFHTVAAGL